MFSQCKDLYITLNIKANTIVRTMHNLTPHLVQSGFQVLKTETLNLKSVQFLPHQVLFGHQMIEANNLLRRNKDEALILHENTIDLFLFNVILFHFSPCQVCIPKCVGCESAFLQTLLQR